MASLQGKLGAAYQTLFTPIFLSIRQYKLPIGFYNPILGS